MPWVTIANPPLDLLGTVPGVQISDVAGRNGLGVGRLRVDAAGKLAWQAPGSDTFGTAVDVSAGGTFDVADGDDADRWLEATVTAAELPGELVESEVRLSEQFNNAVADDDVTAAEASAGNVHSWSFNLANRDATNPKTLAVWLDVYTAQFIEISDDNLAWVAPTTEAAGLALTLPAAGAVTLYLRRTIAAGAPSSPGRRLRVRWKATDGTSEYGEVVGLWRIFETANLRAYQADGETPVPGVDTPLDTFASLPHQVTTAIGDGDHHLVLTRHNGVREAPAGHVARLHIAGGVEVLPPPSDPQDLWLEQRSGGVVRVHARYPKAADGAHPATLWAIWKGTYNPQNPGPPDETVAVYGGRGFAVLSHDLTPAFGDAQTATITVRMQRGVTYSAGYETASLVVSIDNPAAPTRHGVYPGVL